MGILCQKDSSNDNQDDHQFFLEQMEDMKDEREALFGFTDEERDAWSNIPASTSNLDPSLMKEIEEARRLQREEGERRLSSSDSSGKSGLSHVSEDGESVNMVDVGEKATTRRVAVARSEVHLPPEVVSSFEVSGLTSDLVGPKGPIFATAKVAGIMAAK